MWSPQTLFGLLTQDWSCNPQRSTKEWLTKECCTAWSRSSTAPPQITPPRSTGMRVLFTDCGVVWELVWSWWAILRSTSWFGYLLVSVDGCKVYERIKRIWFKLLGQPGSLGIFTIGGNATLPHSLMESAMAKTVATVLTYPVQTVQSRLRAYKAKNQHANLQSVVVQIWQEQVSICLPCANLSKGFAGFFRGLTSKMLQTVSAAALMFLVYERIVFWTRKAVAAAWKARLLLTAK